MYVSQIVIRDLKTRPLCQRGYKNARSPSSYHFYCLPQATMKTQMFPAPFKGHTVHGNRMALLCQGKQVAALRRQVALLRKKLQGQVGVILEICSFVQDARANAACLPDSPDSPDEESDEESDGDTSARAPAATFVSCLPDSPESPDEESAVVTSTHAQAATFVSYLPDSPESPDEESDEDTSSLTLTYIPLDAQSMIQVLCSPPPSTTTHDQLLCQLQQHEAAVDDYPTSQWACHECWC